MSLFRRISRAANRALAPLGIELRRRVRSLPRRPTLRGALERLRERGFSPATVVDVGVGTGTWALYETFPGARHVLIEPLAEFAPDLDRIAAQFPGTERVLAAAGALPGVVELNVGAHPHLTSLYQLRDPSWSAGERRTVPVVTLDQLWHHRELRAPALLKIDVEGAELEVLSGAHAMLPNVEYLVLEVALRELHLHAPRVEDVVLHLRDAGFVLIDILDLAYGPDGTLRFTDLAFVPRDGWLRRMEGS
jgi:FkbM family methyltransferase